MPCLTYTTGQNRCPTPWIEWILLIFFIIAFAVFLYLYLNCYRGSNLMGLLPLPLVGVNLNVTASNIKVTVTKNSTTVNSLPLTTNTLYALASMTANLTPSEVLANSATVMTPISATNVNQSITLNAAGQGTNYVYVLATMKTDVLAYNVQSVWIGNFMPTTPFSIATLNGTHLYLTGTSNNQVTLTSNTNSTLDCPSSSTSPMSSTPLPSYNQDYSLPNFSSGVKPTASSTVNNLLGLNTNSITPNFNCSPSSGPVPPNMRYTQFGGLNPSGNNMNGFAPSGINMNSFSPQMNSFSPQMNGFSPQMNGFSPQGNNMNLYNPSGNTLNSNNNLDLNAGMNKSFNASQWILTSSTADNTIVTNNQLCLAGSVKEDKTYCKCLDVMGGQLSLTSSTAAPTWQYTNNYWCTPSNGSASLTCLVYNDGKLGLSNFNPQTISSGQDDVGSRWINS